MRLARLCVVWGALCLLGAVVQADAGAETIRVATINAANYLVTDRLVDGVYRSAYPKPEAEKAALRALLHHVAADVVILQEMGPEPFLAELQRDLAREGLDYAQRVLLPGHDPDRHLALLSRHPVREILLHTDLTFTYFGETVAVKRGLLEVVFDSPAGPWRLFNVHLKSRWTDRADDPQSLERRNGEAWAIRDRIAQRLDEDPAAPLLVGGDFNDTIGSRPLARFRHINDRPLLHPIPCVDSRGESWTHFYAREDVYSRVDYFLASPAMLSWIRHGEGKIVDDLDFSPASDHRLLWIELRMPDTPEVP